MEPSLEKTIGIVGIIGRNIHELTMILVWGYIYVNMERGTMKEKYFDLFLCLAVLMPAAALIGRKRGEI